ncbi:MAG: metallophosphoesterase [Candidatus Nanoarchaeia archaeon]|nr:metallophosphoesterase [Candidatus Nanoarchaeia archaeon]
MIMKVRFNKNTASFCIGKTLIVADMHIGVEKELRRRGITVVSQTSKMLEKLIKIGKRTKSQSLMILGDFKHSIPLISWQEQNEIPFFIEKLSSVFKEIIIVRGNHDAGLEDLARKEKVKVKIIKEQALGGFGFIHGHAFPSKEMMSKVKIIIAGHVHPEYKLRDRVESITPNKAWFIGECEFHGVKKKIILVPAFNELVGGAGESTEKFMKHVDIKEVLLLDLTKML